MLNIVLIDDCLRQSAAAQVSSTLAGLASLLKFHIAVAKKSSKACTEGTGRRCSDERSECYATAKLLRRLSERSGDNHFFV
jgi:hypothetical protein